MLRVVDVGVVVGIVILLRFDCEWEEQRGDNGGEEGEDALHAVVVAISIGLV